MDSRAIELMNQALWLVLTLSAPPILVASAVGLLVAVLQAATQLQEQTVQYTLKFIAIVLTIFLMAGFFSSALLGLANHVFSEFPVLARP